MLKVNNIKFRKGCGICSQVNNKDTRTTSTSIVVFEQEDVYVMNSKSSLIISTFSAISPLQLGVAHLYPLKTSENLHFF